MIPIGTKCHQHADGIDGTNQKVWNYVINYFILFSISKYLKTGVRHDVINNNN